MSDTPPVASSATATPENVPVDTGPVYIAATTEPIVIRQNSVLTVENAIVMKMNGETIGALDATFDFSKLDPRLYETALSMACRRSVVLMHPASLGLSEPEPSPPSPPTPRTFWQRIADWWFSR